MPSGEPVEIWRVILRNLEDRQSTAFEVDTGDTDRDGLINHFAKKAMVSYLVNKSGFRDNLQNDMGVTMFDWPVAL